MFTALSVVLVSASACIAASPPQASSASGQAVRTWSEIGRAQAAGNPLQHARVLAIMHAAQHDAVNGAVPRYQTHASNLSDPDADAEAAAVAAPQFQNVSPFTLNDRTQFVPHPQPALTSATYTRDFDEVKRFGQDMSSARTADQTHLGHFWAESSPVGWSRVGNIVSSRRGYDLHETARLQALLNMAMADGFIVGWFQKRHFAFWRPVTAIREADTDGNPSTTADAGWMALRTTPPLPDYPSTHSVLGGVAAEILRRFTGADSFQVAIAHSLRPHAP